MLGPRRDDFRVTGKGSSDARLSHASISTDTLVIKALISEAHSTIVRIRSKKADEDGEAVNVQLRDDS